MATQGIEIKAKRGGGSGEELHVGSSLLGDLSISQVLPYGALLTGVGESYTAITTAAVAAIVDEPATTALFTLYNNESDGGKTFIIERIFCFQDIGSAPEARFSLWACVHPIGRAADTADITLINNLRGVSSYGGNAILDVGATVTNDGWTPWESGDSLTVASLSGPALSANVDGRMLVPPSAAVSLQVVASTIDLDFTTGFHWREVQLDLE